MLAVGTTLAALSGSTALARSSGSLPPAALFPNAVAFADRSNGVLGTGYRYSGHDGGSIELTSDGGRTWHVVLRTPRPVVFVTHFDGALWARYDDGENLRSTNGGRTWRPAVPPGPQFSTCPAGMTEAVNNGSRNWTLCTTEGGAGAMGKAVYHLTDKGWKRLAYTLFPQPRAKSVGGLSVLGYPLGISMATEGFGMIWEDRGPLYVTHDGGRHWTANPNLVVIDYDYGLSALALHHGVGYFLKSKGGAGGETLYKTTNASRTWHVVHRWAVAR